MGIIIKVMKGAAILLLLAVGTFALQTTTQKKLMSLKGEMGEKEDFGGFDGEMKETRGGKEDFEGEFDFGDFDFDDFKGEFGKFDGEFGKFDGEFGKFDGEFGIRR